MKKALMFFIPFMVITIYLTLGLKQPKVPVDSFINVYLTDWQVANGYIQDTTCTLKTCTYTIVYYTEQGVFTIKDYPENLLKLKGK